MVLSAPATLTFAIFSGTTRDKAGSVYVSFLFTFSSSVLELLDVFIHSALFGTIGRFLDFFNKEDHHGKTFIKYITTSGKYFILKCDLANDLMIKYR